jgi:hypothetical protein
MSKRMPNRNKTGKLNGRLRRVQERLERLYGLEHGPDVSEFVRIANDGSREQLLIRELGTELELALVLPPNIESASSTAPSDLWLQVLEGVSHFVYIVERARTGLPATQLELELQAEVDKFVLLAIARRSFDTRAADILHTLLYERVAYLHDEGTEAGERYRLANSLAARFVRRIVDLNERELRLRMLRRFYRSGQTEKIALARAA